MDTDPRGSLDYELAQTKEVCANRGLNFRIHWSEVENIYWLEAEDPFNTMIEPKHRIYFEVKRAKELSDGLTYLRERILEKYPNESQK